MGKKVKEKKTKPIKDKVLKTVLVATPCYNGMVHMDYMTSLLSVVMQGPARGYDIQVLTNTDSLVTRARNNAVATFLDREADLLFWIDSDIGFSPDQFFRVLDADKDVAAAAYPLKQLFYPTEPAKLAGRDLEASMLRYAVSFQGDSVAVPDDGFAEVLEAATGFMCIKRWVLLHMIENYPELRYASDQDNLGAPSSQNHYLFFDTMVEGNRYLSEDYAFCRRAQKVGIKIWLDLFSTLTHTGPYAFRGSIQETNRAVLAQ